VLLLLGHLLLLEYPEYPEYLEYPVPLQWEVPLVPVLVLLQEVPLEVVLLEVLAD
jgi:hypothetical protein